MNRYDRRRMKRGGLVNISIGVLLERDLNYGTSVTCYVCGTPHLARGVASIEDIKSGTVAGVTHVPLCNPCLEHQDTTSRIVKNHLNAPDLKVSEGGELTEEQVLALVEGRGACPTMTHMIRTAYGSTCKREAASA
jgi:hypothetical protein